jgi:tetratricopeptide (TPR) repeat protein
MGINGCFLTLSEKNWSMKICKLLFMGLLLGGLWACGGQEDSAKSEDKQAPEDPQMAQINLLSQKIQESPDNPELYFQRANSYYEMEGFDQAIADLQQAMMIDSTQPAYYHLLADTYLDYFKSYNALQTMQVAAEKFPNNLHTLLKLSEFQYLLKKYQDSYKTIDQILQKDPLNSEAYFMMGLNLKEQGDTIRAINAFQSSVENNPDNVDAWLILGQLYENLGDKIALRYFDNAVRVDSSSMKALHAKAVYLHNQGQSQEALDIYREINIKNPSYEDAYYNAGIIYLELDSLDKAYLQFDMLVKTSPIYIMGYYQRGLTSELMGNVAQAKADYEQTLKFAPEYEPAKEGLQRLNQ